MRHLDADEAAQVFPAVLKYLGKDPNSANPDDYKAALDLLKQIRPYIRQFSSSGYIDELAATCAWSTAFGRRDDRPQARPGSQEVLRSELLHSLRAARRPGST